MDSNFFCGSFFGVVVAAVAAVAVVAVVAGAFLFRIGRVGLAVVALKFEQEYEHCEVVARVHCYPFLAIQHVWPLQLRTCTRTMPQ